MTPKDAETALSEELHRIAPDVDVGDIDRNGDLREEFDIDSMDFLNLVTALGRRFGLPIPEADYPELASFTKATAYLSKQVP